VEQTQFAPDIPHVTDVAPETGTTIGGMLGTFASEALESFVRGEYLNDFTILLLFV
jgi:hypothetical protein